MQKKREKILSSILTKNTQTGFAKMYFYYHINAFAAFWNGDSNSHKPAIYIDVRSGCHGGHVAQKEYDGVDDFIYLSKPKKTLINDYHSGNAILICLLSGIRLIIGSATAGSDHPRRPISVKMTVGFTLFTLIPWGPYSCAAARVKASTAPFEAQ